jgi:hypothetical protein
MSPLSRAAKNRLLAALPGRARQHLLARCEQAQAFIDHYVTEQQMIRWPAQLPLRELERNQAPLAA